jgi:hypothetical protein
VRRHCRGDRRIDPAVRVKGENRMKLFKVTGDRFELRVPLMKYDERTGEFEGWATLEQLDHSGEICDIEKSWPYFKAWSEKLAKATDGENLGNVREMHENIAAGKLTAIEKTIHPIGVPGIYVKGIAVDAGSKDKLTKRVLVGLSIGGKYVQKWTDADIDGATRFTADPMEISLVDAPCVPDAMITVVKADGSQELKKAVGFQPAQFWSCRSGVAHGHATKADATRCDGGKPGVAMKKGGVSELLLEKSLYAASSIASVIMSATGVINELAWEARYEGDPADASPNDKLVAGTTLFYEALLEIVENEKDEFSTQYGSGSGDSGEATPDGSAILGDPVFMMTALAEHLKKTPNAFKSLRVQPGTSQSGNGSNGTNKEQENEMDEKQVAKLAEETLRNRLAPLAKQLGLADGADVLAEIVKRVPAGSVVTAETPAAPADALVKSISDLTGAVTGMRDDLKKDRERVDGIEKNVELMGAAFAKTIALMAGVDVDDDADLDEVLKALEKKPAAPKAKARAISKRKDSADEVEGEGEEDDENPTGNPLVTEAKLIAAF